RRDSFAVHDLGWKDDPMSTISRARIVVVPNRVAYFDLLPLEAAALGKGIVFSSVGGNIDQHALLPDSVACDLENLGSGIERAIELCAEDDNWGRRNIDAFERNFTS